jgi:hypothetical protein
VPDISVWLQPKMDFLEILIKVSNTQSHENLPKAAKLIHADRGTERYDEANRTFLRHANMPKLEGAGCMDWGSGC